MHEAITWPNINHILWHDIASLGHDEFYSFMACKSELLGIFCEFSVSSIFRYPLSNIVAQLTLL